MDFFDLLFGPIGPSLQFIFKIGYIPNENDFLELTEDQYAAYVKQCGEIKGKIYMFSPQNPHFSMDDDYNEISCLDEEDLRGFKDAEQLIQHYCDNSKQIFKTTEEKLQYMASALPDVFSKYTPYEKYHHMSIH